MFWVYLLPLLTYAAEPAVEPPSWTFESYLEKFLEQDETYLQAKLNRKVTIADSQARFDVFQNTFELQPSISKTEQAVGTTTFNLERTGVSGTLTQATPTGTTLSVSGLKFLDDPDPVIGGLDVQYEAFFEQALWQNAFGYATRRWKRSAESKIREMTYAESQSLMDSCLDAAQVYLSAYIQQEKMKLRKDIYKDAEKALKIARNGYNQRVLRKIDFLAARSDYLQVKADLLSDQLVYDQSMSTLSYRVGGQGQVSAPQLSKPQTFFEKMPKPRVFDREKVIQLLQSAENLDSAHQNYLATKSQNRTLVNLGLSGRRTESVAATGNSGGAFTNNTTDFIQVYLKLELPLINKTRAGAVSSSHYQWQISELSNRRLEKDLRDNFKQLHLQGEKIRSELKITLENQKIKKQQLVEAKRLLEAGKIEFADYVRYRNSYYAERRKELDLNSSLWQGETQLAQYGNHLGAYCVGGKG